MLLRPLSCAAGSRGCMLAQACSGARVNSRRIGLLQTGARSASSTAPPLAAAATTAAAAAAAAPPSSSAPATSTQQQTVAPAFKVPLDFRRIRDNVAAVTENCARRAARADPSRVASLYGDFLALKLSADELRAARNENSAAMKVSEGERGCITRDGRLPQHILAPAAFTCAPGSSDDHPTHTHRSFH